jgi:hypothetical protein
MFCLTGKDVDENDVEMKIQGGEENVEHQRLEFFYKPCTPVPVLPDVD